MRVLKLVVVLFIFSLFSCEEGGLLIEADISNLELVLIAPGDGVEIASNVVFFDWEEIEDAFLYEIQVASPDFENTQQLLLNVTDSISFYELPISPGDYQWRVRAKNSGYETAYSTASFKVITVQNFEDNVVILSSPEDNLITNVSDQNLQWQNVDGATLYRIQLLEDNTVLDEQTTTELNFDVSFPEGNFSWQIRAENGTENTLYFSRNMLVDITAPNTPNLTLPEDQADLTSGQVTFTWTRDPIGGSDEFDTIYVFSDADLTDLVLSSEVISPFETTLSNGAYFWLIRAFDEAGNESIQSSVFSFTVND